MGHKFVDLGKDGKKVFLYRFNEKKQKLVKVRQVLWGDWLSIADNHDFGAIGQGWLAVNWAPNSPNPQTLYIAENETTDNRPLEVIFLDVSQGDGAVLITPEQGSDERIMVIDAGEGDHMERFLDGRFKAYRGFQFDAAILTHPDKDHYLGFKSLFANKNVGFNTIYQNGLVERPVSGTFEKLGGLTKDAETKTQYISDLATSRAELEKHFNDESVLGRYFFPWVMHYALQNPLILDYKMLSTDADHSIKENGRNYMPGFAPSNGRGYSIEVLGPIVEPDKNGKPRLRKISSYGKTKNGHSILLRLHFGNFKILFGGDLNKSAEKFLLKQYTGLKRFPKKNSAASKKMIKNAKNWFSAEIMKVCHHGASDVTDEFMKTVNPACFVISSGDGEGNVHPRPDLLGRLGKFGRGESPVLLSTELQRSSREYEDKKLVERLKKHIDKLAIKPTDKRRKTIEGLVNELSKNNVAVYGAIYLKTDGKKLITAFKFEEPSDKKKWFYFEYTMEDSGVLKLR
ncbi:MAG: hypothetical protein WBG90_02115 [Saonia sp.]